MIKIDYETGKHLEAMAEAIAEIDAKLTLVLKKLAPELFKEEKGGK